MADLANLLEHEDEVRGEVVAAVAYPVFVLGFGLVTVTVLLTVVLPQVMGMLQDMLPILPLPTLILLTRSAVSPPLLGLGPPRGERSGHRRWRCMRVPRGADNWDRMKLRLPLIGAGLPRGCLEPVCAHTGHAGESGVSLLPSLKIVESTIGNRILAQVRFPGWPRTRGAAIAGGARSANWGSSPDGGADDRCRRGNRPVG